MKRQFKGLNILTQFKKDFSLSALTAGLVVVLVGMTSSAVIVFQAAKNFGASTSEAGSWLGALCVGMGILSIFFSFKYKAPVLVAWSTPGAVLLASSASGFTLNEAIAAFLFSSCLVFIFGITGLFEKIMNRISIALSSALLAGVLLHFCLDALTAFKVSPMLVGAMFGAYLIGKKIWSRMTMLLVLIVGVLVSFALGLFQLNAVDFSLTHFHFFQPQFSFASLINLGIPLFIVTMASQNLTGLSVMRAHQFANPISPLLTGMGFLNFITAFFGGFTLNLAAITASIAMGEESHPDKNRRYVAAVVSGLAYLLIGFFAGSVTSVFAAFPVQMIAAISGFALIGTVAASLETALSIQNQKEAAFLTFIIAASGLSFFGVSSAFWAVIVGFATQSLFQLKK